jgi:hypothetical protein
LFVASLLTRLRSPALGAYSIVVGTAAGRVIARDPRVGAGLALALPCMHIPWALGFFVGLARGSQRNQ